MIEARSSRANVACADVLQIPAKVGERDLRRRADAYETRWPPAMLHVRPSGFADRRQIERVGLLEEVALASRKRRLLRARLHSRVLRSRTVLALQRLHGRREGDVGERSGHFGLLGRS
jgi:hypothetical protein